MTRNPIRVGEDPPAGDITFLFGMVQAGAADVAAFLEALPRLCRGTLGDCELGTGADHVVCVARLPRALAARTRSRLEYWAWRIGGTLSPDRRQAEAALRACDHVLRQVSPQGLAAAGRALLASRLPAGAAPEALRLRLDVASPQAAGITFERRTLALFVPSPRLPPAGDRLTLELRLGGGEAFEAQGVITSLRGPGEGGLGAPAGFVVRLTVAEERLVRALGAEVPAVSPPARRSAPRCPVRALARLTPLDPPAGAAPGTVTRLAPAERGGALDWVENLSQRGAFVRTAEPVTPGTRVRLEVDVPGGDTAALRGEVVHQGDRGLGIRFGDPAAEELVGAVLEAVATRRRRALVVDGDPIARPLLCAQLSAQGFEVFSASDGAAGLSALIDLLLDLDLLVVALHAPSLDAQRFLQLVRGAGGERDLAIAVVGGAVDEATRGALSAAGADAVLSWDDGAAGMVDAAVRAMLRRERSRRSGSHRLDRLA